MKPGSLLRALTGDPKPPGGDDGTPAPPRGRDRLDGILAALRGPDANAPAAAAQLPEVLADAGPERCLRALGLALGHGDPLVREWGVLALRTANIPGDALEERLTGALGDPAATVRAAAITVAGAVMAADASRVLTVERVNALMGAGPGLVRLVLLRALEAHGPDSAAARAAAERGLGDDDEDTRRLAAGILGEQTAATDAAMQALAAAIDDPSEAVAEAAVIALGKLDPTPEHATEALERALRRGTPATQSAALRHLARPGTEERLAAWTADLLASGVLFVQWDLVSALERLARAPFARVPHIGPVAHALVCCAAADDPLIRRHALTSFRLLQSRRADVAAALRPALESDSADHRDAARAALAAFQTP